MSTFINVSKLFRSCSTLQTTKHIAVRYSGFVNSPFLEDVQIKAKYEVTKSPSEWKYVERILPPSTVPELALRDKYNSTFKPQGDVKDRPFIVCRTKNHMIPVYLKISQRGLKRLTYVRKIQGDIWLLGKELETYLQPMSKRPLRMQVNEFTGSIIINGDYVNAVKYWLMERDY